MHVFEYLKTRRKWYNFKGIEKKTRKAIWKFSRKLNRKFRIDEKVFGYREINKYTWNQQKSELNNSSQVSRPRRLMKPPDRLKYTLNCNLIFFL